MIKPHGGKLVKRIANERLKNEAKEMEKIEISKDSAFDAENIGYGVYSPLEGFMCCDDFENVLNCYLSNGLTWTIPIVLDGYAKEGESYALRCGKKIVAVIDVEDVYRFDKKECAVKVFGTDDLNHPGVRKVFHMKDHLIGGKIWFIESVDNRFKEYDFKPEQTREIFKKFKWDHVIGFQTRNAPHLGHEYVQKTAITVVEAYERGRAGLFINPVIGKKKKGDFRDEVIIKSYEELISRYYRKDRVFLGILKTEMRYAGPREAVFHAIIRKNFGCTHFIVGRDHAGVGNYYKPYEAQEIFNEFPDLGIKPLFFNEFHYCRYCGIVSESVCSHKSIKFSGTYVRECIKKGRGCEFMRREVIDRILSYENPFVSDEFIGDEVEAEL